MKTSLRSFFIAAILSVTAVCLQAAEVVSEAVVLKVSGSPTVSTGGQTPVALKVGDKIPVGATITTDDKSAVDIKPFEGTTTTIKAGSTLKITKLTLTTEGGAITKQTAFLDLAVGNVVSTLDPSKKSINDYSIKTPRGVAAARGTQFVTYVTKSGQTIILVAEGTVTVTGSNGGFVSIPAGRAISVAPDGTVTSLSASEATDLVFSLAVDGQLQDLNLKIDNNQSSNIDITIPVVSPSSP